MDDPREAFRFSRCSKSYFVCDVFLCNVFSIVDTVVMYCRMECMSSLPPRGHLCAGLRVHCSASAVASRGTTLQSASVWPWNALTSAIAIVAARRCRPPGCFGFGYVGEKMRAMLHSARWQCMTKLRSFGPALCEGMSLACGLIWTDFNFLYSPLYSQAMTAAREDHREP